MGRKIARCSPYRELAIDAPHGEVNSGTLNRRTDLRKCIGTQGEWFVEADCPIIVLWRNVSERDLGDISFFAAKTGPKGSIHHGRYRRSVGRGSEVLVTVGFGDVLCEMRCYSFSKPSSD